VITVGLPYSNGLPCNNKIRELGDIICAAIEREGGKSIIAVRFPPFSLPFLSVSLSNFFHLPHFSLTFSAISLISLQGTPVISDGETNGSTGMKWAVFPFVPRISSHFPLLFAHSPLLLAHFRRSFSRAARSFSLIFA
jgi:hypothetical protein